jgi:hypothetical protein
VVGGRFSTVIFYARKETSGLTGCFNVKLLLVVALLPPPLSERKSKFLEFILASSF